MGDNQEVGGALREGEVSELLHIDKMGVVAPQGQQFVMCAALDDTSLMEDADKVGVADG